MDEPRGTTRDKRAAAFGDQVNARVARKLRAQRHGEQSTWSGLGMSGLIGWSVVVPTLVGAALGMWIDKHYPGKHTWTLALMMAGLALGCLNAWHWIDKEDKEMRDGNNDE